MFRAQLAAPQLITVPTQPGIDKLAEEYQVLEKEFDKAEGELKAGRYEARSEGRRTDSAKQDRKTISRHHQKVYTRGTFLRLALITVFYL